MIRRLLTPLFALLPATVLAQQPMHLTLADAQRLAVQNNPQYSSWDRPPGLSTVRRAEPHAEGDRA